MLSTVASSRGWGAESGIALNRAKPHGWSYHYLLKAEAVRMPMEIDRDPKPRDAGDRAIPESWSTHHRPDAPPTTETPPRLADLASEFRERAAMLRRYGGAEGTAAVWETAADEVDRTLLAHRDERLNIQEAAILSGYTAGHLRRMVREGKVPTMADGTILRRHLPVKPGSTIADSGAASQSSRTQRARAVAGGE